MMNLKLIKIAIFVMVGVQISTLQAQQIKIAGGHLKVNNTSLVINDFDFVNNGDFSSLDGNVLFSGVSTNTIDGSTVTTFDTLTMQKTSGKVLLEQEAKVDAEIKLVAGLLDIQEHDLTLPSAFSEFNDSSYVQTSSTGVVTIFLEESFAPFPIGNSTLNPIGLENFGTADFYSIRVRDELLENGSTGSPVDLAVNRTWEISEQTPGGSNLLLQPIWHPDNEIGTPLGDYSFAQFNGTWETLFTEPASNLFFLPDFKGIGNSLVELPTLGDFAVFFEENANLLLEEFCTAGGDLNLSDPIAESQAIQVENILTSTQTIAAPSSVIFRAGNSIFLEPGFVAESGTSFRAYIASCTFTPPMPLIIPADESTPPKLEQLNAKVFPNPFVDATTIEFYLPEASAVQIMISDLNGKIIHSEENLKVDSGWQQTTFDAGNLPDGLYYLVIRSDSEQVVEKLVVGQGTP